MTLAFLAEVPDRKLDDLVERLGRGGSRRTAFETAIAGGGAFPNVARARVLWAGLDLDERGEIELDADGDRRPRGGEPGRRSPSTASGSARTSPSPGSATREVTSWVRLLDAYRGPSLDRRPAHPGRVVPR